MAPRPALFLEGRCIHTLPAALFDDPAGAPSRIRRISSREPRRRRPGLPASCEGAFEVGLDHCPRLARLSGTSDVPSRRSSAPQTVVEGLQGHVQSDLVPEPEPVHDRSCRRSDAEPDRFHGWEAARARLFGLLLLGTRHPEWGGSAADCNRGATEVMHAGQPDRCMWVNATVACGSTLPLHLGQREDRIEEPATRNPGRCNVPTSCG